MKQLWLKQRGKKIKKEIEEDVDYEEGKNKKIKEKHTNSRNVL